MIMHITFRGHTNEEFGLDLKSFQVPSKSAERYELKEIPGRLSPLPHRIGQYKSYPLRATFVLRDSADLRAAYEWLSGEGELICSDTPDLYYRALACEVISTKREGAANTIRELAFEFVVLPFAYAVDNDPLIFSDAAISFYSRGTIYSEPVFILRGISGDVTLTVNQVPLVIAGLTGDVYVDVPARKAYQLNGDGSKRIVLANTTGALWSMVLVPSEERKNQIIITGTITQIEIIKNERWI